MQNTFCTDHTPVASHTRQSIAAAAARAALHADRGILVLAAGDMARKASVKLPGPVVPPTLEEMRAAIPDHGIMLPEFFELFFARLRGGENHQAFLANFTALAAQDPVTAHASALQNADGNIVSFSDGTNTVAPPTPEAIAGAAARAARNMNNMIFMGGAFRVTGSVANAVPPTLEEIRAAIPEEGISTHDLVRPFHTRLVENFDSFHMFISHVATVAQQDPVTFLVFLRK